MGATAHSHRVTPQLAQDKSCLIDYVSIVDSARKSEMVKLQPVDISYYRWCFCPAKTKTPSRQLPNKAVQNQLQSTPETSPKIALLL